MRTLTHSDGIIAELISAGKSLAQSNLVQAKAGNLSALRQGRIWLTRTGTDLGKLTIADFVHTKFNKQANLHNIQKPDGATSEFLLHYAVYLKNSQVNCVIHTHPQHLVALSLHYQAGEHIIPIDTEAPFYFDYLPVIDAKPGSVELAEYVSEVLSKHCAVVAVGHGLFVASNSVERALDITFAAEHCAKVRILAVKLK